MADDRPAVRHLPPDTDADVVHAALEEDAAVIVDDLAPGGLLDRLDAEMAPYIEATPGGPDEFSGHSTRRTGGLVARSPAAHELVMHPLALATCDRVLGHGTTFQLHLTQIISIGPGETVQPVHRDMWAFDFFPFPDGYDVQCNTIWALTDFTEENGATRLVPGSHHDENHQGYSIDDTVPAEMSRGSVLFYTGRVYHGGGPNRTDAVRRGVNITYCTSWVRQEENQYLSVPPEIARELPVDLLKLIGYDRGAYALGYIDDLRHPLEALGVDSGEEGFGNTTVDDLDPAALLESQSGGR